MAADELRTYTIAPGKMAAIQSVMAEIMVPLMKDHAIEPIAFWATPDEDKVYWIARHSGLDVIEHNWKRFHADPRWTEPLAKRTGGTPFVTDQSSVPLLAFGGRPLPWSDPT